MTVSDTEFANGFGNPVYSKCGRPAKFINPKPQMGVQYVCGIHARSLDKMFEHTRQEVICLPL